MFRSAFLRAVILNELMRSVVDLQGLVDVGKIDGNLGWVAGLLKWWLAERRGREARAVDVEALMMEFYKLQAKVKAIMSKVLYQGNESGRLEVIFDVALGVLFWDFRRFCRYAQSGGYPVVSPCQLPHLVVN